MDLIELELGKVVNKKWMVEALLGEGNCGVVYRVHDVNNKKLRAAMKTEALDQDHGVLKKEANVIKQLQNRKHVVRMFYCGKREQYSYIIMTLYGRNLNQLKKDYNLETLSHGCVTKIAVHVLYAIKQVHEVGYVHRDVKPSNMVIGRHGRDKRMVYLIDFGYVMVELADFLPWTGKKEPEIAKMKAEIPDNILLQKCPPEWIELFQHVRRAKYEERPNYRFLYDQMVACMKRLKTTFSDPYDWEVAEEKQRGTKSKVRDSRVSGKIRGDSHQETGSNKSTISTRPTDTDRTRDTLEQKNEDPSPHPFPTVNPAEFDSNDIKL